LLDDYPCVLHVITLCTIIARHSGGKRREWINVQVVVGAHV
jgi:hypothetical protein